MAEKAQAESPLGGSASLDRAAKSEEKPPDDSKFFTVAEFEHPPATPHGTYLKRMDDSLEELEHYEEGGYHPVHLHDCFGPDDRYRAIHKLGGGGFATVWLCRDVQEKKYVVLKISTADTPVDRLVELSLPSLDQTEQGAEFIATPLDHFSFHGPNGHTNALFSQSSALVLRLEYG